MPFPGRQTKVRNLERLAGCFRRNNLKYPGPAPAARPSARLRVEGAIACVPCLRCPATACPVMPTPPDPRYAADTASAALIRHIGHVIRLHAERKANAPLGAALERVAAWQALRLRQTYADLRAQPRYVDAVDFFETDLYGEDFARRDADLARVVPIMVRTLPEGVIASIAEAMELNALAQELDRALLARLPRPDGHFTVAEYCRAYRRMNDRTGRERQIRLTADIGEALDGFVKKPFIRSALLVMRHPARLAGMSVLHDFLERGFAAFHRMGGAGEFLATIVKRETALMDAIFSGDNAPFPDPCDRADLATRSRAAGTASPVRMV